MPDLSATYRLQLRGSFGLASVSKLVEYLDSLGISHVYLSPILKSRKGSPHGYDVVDPDHLDPELGTEEDLRELARRLHERNMGILLDIVPNHMAACEENPRWEHVLTFGRRSPYAGWFDIDWSTPQPELRGKVLLPVLGQRRSRTLRNGELTLRYEYGRIRLCYFDHRFPLSPQVTADVLAHGKDGLAKTLGADHEDVREYQSTLLAFSAAQKDPGGNGLSRAARRLADLCNKNENVRRHVTHLLSAFMAGDDGRKQLERILDRQAYRLVYWRRAAREINYRRFFDINELVGIRMEDDQVFNEYHQRVLSWIGAGIVDALRIDHIDGLLDPQDYLHRLSAAANNASGFDCAGLYVEKILATHETLPEDWPVEGTTGYEFLNRLEALFIDPSGHATIERSYVDLLGKATNYADVAYKAKRRILTGSLSSYIRALVRLFESGIRREPGSTRLDRGRRGAAIVEFLAALDVYRTYMSPRAPQPRMSDRNVIERAMQRAVERAPSLAKHLDTLRRILIGESSEALAPPSAAARLRFIQRLQQTSGPAAAKGVEDTAIYVHVPLVSRNEVGAEPDDSLDEAVRRFHEANRHAASRWPRSLLCTSTHDTKRSADVRSRLDVLSEVPEQWFQHVRRWRRQNAGFRRRVGGRWTPDANTEYLLYQTLVGVWPLDDETRDLHSRLKQYMLKAMREAKTRTSWVQPNAAYESAVNDFIDALFRDAHGEAFLRDVAAFTDQIARPGLWNALARTLVHLTAPGVPDLYQGDELWNFSLVDPDNRRPVDFGRRAEFLGTLTDQWHRSSENGREFVHRLVANPEDGRIKLHVVSRALATRRRFPDLFSGGAYDPLAVTGRAAEHVIAFQRRRADAIVVTVVPRLILSLTEDPAIAPTGEGIWGDTTAGLPDHPEGCDFRCAMTDQVVGTANGKLKLAEALRDFPVTLLVSASRCAT